MENNFNSNENQDVNSAQENTPNTDKLSELPPLTAQPEQNNPESIPENTPQFNPAYNPPPQNIPQNNAPEGNYPPPQYYNYNGRYVPPVYGGYNPYPQPPVKEKKKRLSGLGLGIVIALFVIMAVLIVVLSVLLVSNGGKSKSDASIVSPIISSGEKKNNKIQITIPTSEKPQLNDKLYADQASGLLTTEGVAEKVMPSQILIGVYNDGPYQMTAAGSGIIITSDGYILTNAHVIDGAARLKAVLNDGTQYEAKIVGIDKQSDVGVIKIETTGLTTAEFGNSDTVKLGEDVAVVGASGTLESFITYGHVSAVEREIETNYESGKLKCIQTDAALNPGNSGGALVNMYGQVVGLSVAGMDHSAYDGIGFAIEINDVIPVAEELMAQGYVKGRARVGIMFTSVTDEMKAAYEIPRGLCVIGIDKTCDVSKKDVRAYDIITEIDGESVWDTSDVKKVMADKYAGQTVTLTIFRKEITDDEGKELTVEIVLAQKIDTPSASESENYETYPEQNVGTEDKSKESTEENGTQKTNE